MDHKNLRIVIYIYIYIQHCIYAKKKLIVTYSSVGYALNVITMETLCLIDHLINEKVMVVS